jgi:DNA polymerase eta
VKIFGIISKHCKIVKKASVDEAFLDLTEEVELYMSEDKLELQNLYFRGKVLGLEENTQEEIQKLMFCSVFREINVRLAVASILVERIRLEVLQKLKYTCSAGISVNVMLSKLASGLNKPFN